MALNSIQIIRITREIATGKLPEEPDSLEEAEFRVKVQLDIDKIRARGNIVDIPFEMP